MSSKICFSWSHYSILILLFALQPGCSKQNDTPDSGAGKKDPAKKAQMPKRNATREAELAAQRNKRLLALEPVEKKVLAGLGNWSNAQEGQQGEVAVLPFGESLVEALISPDALKLALVFWRNKKLDYQILDFPT